MAKPSPISYIFETNLPIITSHVIGYFLISTWNPLIRSPGRTCMFSAACSGKSAISSSKGDRFRAGLREVLTGVSSTPSWPPARVQGRY